MAAGPVALILANARPAALEGQGGIKVKRRRDMSEFKPKKDDQRADEGIPEQTENRRLAKGPGRQITTRRRRSIQTSPKEKIVARIWLALENRVKHHVITALAVMGRRRGFPGGIALAAVSHLRSVAR